MGCYGMGWDGMLCDELLWDELLKKPNINYNNFSNIGMHLFIKKGMTRKNYKCTHVQVYRWK